MLNNYTFRFFGILVLVAMAMLPACRQSPTDVAGSDDKTAGGEAFVSPVEVMILEEGTFYQELLSNGRLRANRKARLTFPFSDEVVALHVINGQRVAKGEVLAALCQKELDRQLERARMSLKRNSIGMEDLLLGHGYTLKDSLTVPEHIWQMAGINSGYFDALTELNNLETDRKRAEITAPFAGLVSGLETRLYERVGAGSAFCTLIDDKAFLVDFPVMESELPLVKKGGRTEVVPFSMPSREYNGRIHSIDPAVNEAGQIMVTALLSATSGLMEGMNVKVRVLNEVTGQMVVPRQAVVYRDNLEVLFKYEKGQAVWTYVHVVQQNSSHFSVVANPDRVASLQAGDTVVVSGNMNLSHGAAVEIKQAW